MRKFNYFQSDTMFSAIEKKKLNVINITYYQY